MREGGSEGGREGGKGEGKVLKFAVSDREMREGGVREMGSG